MESKKGGNGRIFCVVCLRIVVRELTIVGSSTRTVVCKLLVFSPCFARAGGCTSHRLGS